jgi:hypothetical protein
MYDIPYRMVFAVATQNSLLLYDTQQASPFARIARIHYTRLTDLSWYLLYFNYVNDERQNLLLIFFVAFLGQVTVALLSWHPQTAIAPL